VLFDLATIDPSLAYKLLVSTVTPRPIAWVVSQDGRGVLNAAPFSFFNAFSPDPPVIGIGVGRRSAGAAKDTRANITETGEFVVNLVSAANAKAMNVTAIDFDAKVDELAEAGLTTVPSAKVKPPRIAESPVAFECSLMQVVELGSYGLVLGRVLAIHIRDEAVLDPVRCSVNTPALGLIGRMHGTGWYARTTDLFEMPRLTVKDWAADPTPR
jgi:flavin reductase (DIM6/NTAB) family NADH-FMN oxidoreductase RutF